MKTLLLIVGILLFLSGALWACQGMGWIMWPKSSFMLQDMKWTYIGAATAVVGLGVIFFSRRR